MRRLGAEDGSALVLGWTGVACTVVALLLTVDLAAYLLAGARAQAAADAAALAAVARSDARARLPGDARSAARRVADANGAALRACRCHRGAAEVEVVAAVAVRALAVTRFAGRSVTATARARLVADGPPADGRPWASSRTAAFQHSLQRFIAASRGRIRVVSATRSRSEQTRLWRQALERYGSVSRARRWVAPPGQSRHELGLAADLAFADAAVRTWAHRNATRFGLRFPLAHEPWHIEPVER